ncbi:MAG: 2-succinyl-5-enolpyruvyl-6-hydroxy-3-cyclohexene-1-carboxylic-acid synthase [Flavobacteriaceae bacterium]|nr:2-succinyl-5-enolpyruvyl-6-hydroxy-3-cyclohexene-1-carboxylic-acid synthase [Flavobacteriaceae bacterium]
MQIVSKHLLSQLAISFCQKYGVDTVVVSPGSRNAPLIIGFDGAKNIELLSVVDERCAGFFALGIAQQKRKPVALVCTSGSALLNYYPAIAEAFYSHIPLIVLSADRPKHLIDIGDGQTIRQRNVFENHTCYNANLDGNDDEKELEKAFQSVLLKNQPVHINIPFDEPLYEYEEVNLPKPKMVYFPKEQPFNEDLTSYAEIWNTSTKKMILVGQNFPDKDLQMWLEKMSEDPSVLVLVENTANVTHSKFVNSIDQLIFPFDNEEIKAFSPDVLLTLGGLVVSKKIKQYLRKFQPKNHWHIDTQTANDTFHCLTKHFKATPNLFFKEFSKKIQKKESNFQEFWLQKKAFRKENHQKFLEKAPFSDLKVFAEILSLLPKNRQLQLSNSSVVRYSQLFDIHSSIQVFCNRGTSGIDGSTSTAVGAGYASKLPTVFVTGDISFFYDSNGLWNKYIPNDFKIILLNNRGGGIFRFIPGPQKTKSLSYFETPHQLTAFHLCQMFDIKYITVGKEKELTEKLHTFFEEEKSPVLLEIFTPRELNDKVLKSYFEALG